MGLRQVIPLHGKSAGSDLWDTIERDTIRTHACSRKDMMVADSVIVRPSISITGSSPDGTLATNSAGLDLPTAHQHRNVTI